ncbi:salicylate synthase [Azospirillum oleiclasticum]|uniref:salicylate synthase n=1 Tax=Azospirillum oleiclasticum TaxID=2735135 RepID=UPI0031B5DA01
MPGDGTWPSPRGSRDRCGSHRARSTAIPRRRTYPFPIRRGPVETAKTADPSVFPGGTAARRDPPRAAQVGWGADVVPWPADLVERYERQGYWGRETLGELPRRWAAVHGDRCAIVDHRGPTSYAALDGRVDRMASGLHALGVGPGDRVLVQLPNTATFVVTCFALFRLGAMPILVMPAQRINDLDGLCKLAEPVAFVVQDRFLGFDYRPMAEELAKRHGSLRHVVVDGEAGPHHRLEDLDDPPLRNTGPRPGDIACLLLSGGTTGTPKLIPRTHADYAYNARASAALCGLSAESVYLAALPAAHNFTFACPGILGTLLRGGRVVMARTPGGDETFPLIAREKVTFTALVPALVDLWLRQREWDTTDLSSLQLLQVGGARLMPDMARRIGPALGCRVQQVLGMAEGLLCYTRLDDSEEVVINTQGRPLSPDDEVRIVDAAGRDVPPGEPGELLTRGPYTIRGYYRAERHNRTAFTSDGFYRSGDLVRRRADGNLVVEGRIKEQINRAGEKIAVAEIEEHLRAHPAVDDAVLLGVPDPILGERSRAVLIAGGSRPELADLHAFLRDRGLARHQLPDELGFVSSWPLTAVGKIDKKRLADPSGPRVAGASAFREETIPLAVPPLPLAALLAESGLEERAMVYERNGEWSVGLGTLAELRIEDGSVRLLVDGSERDWPAAAGMDGVEAALPALPWRGWRAYGTATFELARRFQGLDTTGGTDGEVPLRLFIPRMECRLREGTAVLRAVEEGDLRRVRAAFDDACRRVMEEGNGMAARRHACRLEVSAVETEDAGPYTARVAAALSEIAAGHYTKVILSRRVPLGRRLDIAASYLAGREINQPVRSFLLIGPEFQAAGFSPETVVEVDAGGSVSTQPLAGTRALDADETGNAARARELHADPKEVAEHAVSVRLAFEELASVCAPGSVAVVEFMEVRRRGAVQHLASRLTGRLGGTRDRWHAFQTLFPAVTASGIPKREAVEAIGRLEEGPRGLYAGCVLLADDDGSLDAALVLRSVFQDRGGSWLQAGAGVVALSTPERELRETCEKLSGVARGLVAAPDPVAAVHSAGERE